MNKFALVRRYSITTIMSMLLVFAITACPKGQGMSSDKYNELAARNMELEKRISELERKIQVMEVAMGAGWPAVASGQPPRPAGAGPTIPPSNLQVVKVRPPAPMPRPEIPGSAPYPDTQPGELPPPLFGDEPGFAEGPTVGSDSNETVPEEPPVVASPSSNAADLPVEGATLYESAVGQFHLGNYDLASEAFMLYITRYPGTVYESSALFYLGECKYNGKKYKDAIEQFRRYMMKYPDGNEAPMALLRMGMSFMRLDDKENAKKAFRQLMDRFPDSPASEAARREMDSMI